MLKKFVVAFLSLAFFHSALAAPKIASTLFINTSNNYMVIKYQLCPKKGNCPSPTTVILDNQEGRNWYQLNVNDPVNYKALEILQTTKTDSKGNVLVQSTRSCYGQADEALIFDDLQTNKFIFCLKHPLSVTMEKLYVNAVQRAVPQ